MRITRKHFYIGVDDICKSLRIGEPKFYDWIETEKLPAVRLPDGRWILALTMFDQWIRMLGKRKANNSKWTVPKQCRPRGPQALAEDDIIFEVESDS